MTKFHSVFFIAAILLLPFVSKGQFSRQQAINLVLDEILVSDTAHIYLYTSYDTIPNTSNITLANGETIIPPYQQNWVFFSDDKPFANWDHSCRFIFVDSHTGDFNTYTNSSYPFDLLASYQALSSAVIYPCPADCYHDTTIPPPPSSIHVLPTKTNSHLHAVLINGIDRLDPQWGSCTCNFDYDIAMIYNALEEVGYTTHYNPPPVPPNTGPNESNVIVLYDDGSTTYPYAGKTSFHNNWDGYPNHIPNQPYHEVDGPATKSNILEVFNKLAVGGMDELTPEDQLFVYITGNGHLMNNQTDAAFECYHLPTTPPTSSDYLTVTELRNAVKNINCAQIIFVMQQSYSGKFVDPLINIPALDPPLCKNRLVFTATGDGSIAYPKTDSYKELWMHCGNIDEFTYYFAAALRGHYEARYPWELLDYPTGEFPFNDPTYGPPWTADGCPNITPHPADYNPDANNDGYVQLIEAFNYAKYMDTWCQDGYKNQRQYMDVRDPLNPSSWIFNWPTYALCTDYETPMMGVSNGFGTDNLYCLNGIAGKTSTSGTQTIVGGRSYLLGGTVNVHSNMHVDPNTEISLGVDNTQIIVDENSQFTVGFDFTLKGLANDNALEISNYNNHLDLKSAHFKSVSFQHYGSILNIGDANHQSTFDNCGWIGSSRGMVTVINSIFNNSTLSLYQCQLSLTDEAIVDNCLFTGSNSTLGCQVSDYKKYKIINNTINGGCYGLYLSYIGSTSGNHLIRNNHISGCNVAGMCIYGSEASLEMNHIEHCTNYGNWQGIGLEIFNNCNISMSGNAYAQNISQTQEINDCDGLEFYATNSCLPYYMKYNAFIDDNNSPGDPIFYYDNSKTGFPVGYTIGYNCWGQTFSPSDDLKVNYGELWPNPTWCPAGGAVIVPPDEDMYKTGVNDVDSNMYSQAKSVFKLLIETYPKSIYAQAAMKALYHTESLSENDWSGLQMFYLTNDSIIADTTLTKLGDFLVNQCDIQMHNYGNAISWYENKIQNAPDPNDSVFAIIDLGHLYSTMDTTGDGPTYIGSMPQYKPTSQARYIAYRDSLISLLPFKKEHINKGTSKLVIGQLLKIVPNPSKSLTEFYVKLSGAKTADIMIYDSWGKLEQTVLITNFSDGPQRITFNTSNLASGIYECMLNVNGKRTDLKKLIVIR